jgi:hypothetical protein
MKIRQPRRGGDAGVQPGEFAADSRNDREIADLEEDRVTLFIGNRNPKGEAAVRSGAAQLGKIFPAPQGLLGGLAGREIVDLPSPFGARTVHDWESPELDLFPGLLGAREVRVKVGFESGLANTSAAALAHFGLASAARFSELSRRSRESSLVSATPAAS